MPDYDVAVVGSGVIGLSAAWKIAAAGSRVVVLDPHPGRGPSYAAAGMLAPVTEAAYGEEPLLAVTLRSAAAWPAFAAEVERSSGLRVGLEQCGTLLVGVDGSDRDYLEQLLEFHHHLGLDSRWCRASECRHLEPLLDPGVSGGLFATGDQQVDNRRLLAALAVAAANAGVQFVTDHVTSLVTEDGSVRGVRTRHGSEIRATATLVAGGVTSSELCSDDLPPARPVKGQILRLRRPASAPPLSRTVRAVVRGRSVYVVPRSDGRVVVGATMEEHEDPGLVTAGGVYELLRDAVQVLPSLREYELLESYAAARPGSPDNAPIVGSAATPGLLVATGHFRHGILLAPVTTEILQSLLAGDEAPAWADPLSPSRFVKALR